MSSRAGYIITLTLLWIGVVANAHAEDRVLKLNALPYEQCVDATLQADQAPENQRYWFSRVPPYVGFSKGEKTPAGGDGTCYLGFPDGSKASGLVMVDGTAIEVFPIPTPGRKSLKFKSRDGKTIVGVHITGNDSTCRPDADQCCGDYTYATITVRQDGKSTRVKAANYVGG